MKKKISIARMSILIGTFVIVAGLLLNSFELINVRAFRIVTFIGIAVQFAAIIAAFIRKEF